MSKQGAHLQHLAIIPDGNRRWAKQHAIGGEEKIYERGNKTTFEIIKAAFAANIPYVTFWASSYSNLMTRPKALVGAIEKIYAREFHKLAEHELIHDNEVKVQVLGEWASILKNDAKEAIQHSMDATAHYNKRTLTVLVGYDGVRERGEAVRSLLSTSQSQSEHLNDFSKAADLLRKHAWTGHLPDVDLVIRTGSWLDPHNSTGYLCLLTDNSQYSYPPVLWPDFSTEMFNDILADFSNRERRYGR